MSSIFHFTIIPYFIRGVKFSKSYWSSKCKKVQWQLTKIARYSFVFAGCVVIHGPEQIPNLTLDTYRSLKILSMSIHLLDLVWWPDSVGSRLFQPSLQSSDSLWRFALHTKTSHWSTFRCEGRISEGVKYMPDHMCVCVCCIRFCKCPLLHICQSVCFSMCVSLSVCQSAFLSVRGIEFTGQTGRPILPAVTETGSGGPIAACNPHTHTHLNFLQQTGFIWGLQ